MDYFALYAVLVMMILAILVDRVLRRRINAEQRRNRDILRKVDDLMRSRDGAEKLANTLRDEIAETDRRIATAVDEVHKAEKTLEDRKNQPIRRYYVFDRLEPRPGNFWECDLALERPPAGASRALIKSWFSGRCYVIVAKNESEARSRIESRFPSQNGYLLRGIRPCVLTDPDAAEGQAAAKPIIVAEPVEEAPTGTAALWAALRGGS